MTEVHVNLILFKPVKLKSKFRTQLISSFIKIHATKMKLQANINDKWPSLIPPTVSLTFFGVLVNTN